MPIISIPDGFIVDRIGTICGILRDDLFAGEIAFPVKEASFVPESETSDHTLRRA